MTDIAVERCCWDIKKFANVDCMIKGCIYTSVAYGYLHVFLNNQKPTFYMWLIGDMHNACKYLKTEFREQNDWKDHSSFKHVTRA
jgi:coenzyme F420-reducing hydrogenase gamma subunit